MAAVEGRVAFAPALVPPAVWDAARKSAGWVPSSSPVTKAPMLCPWAATRLRSTLGKAPQQVARLLGPLNVGLAGPVRPGRQQLGVPAVVVGGVGVARADDHEAPGHHFPRDAGGSSSTEALRHRG